MSLTDKLLKYMDFTKEYGKPSDETIDYFLQSTLAKQLLIESPKYLVSSESVKESADSLWSNILKNYDSDDSITLEPKYNGGFDFYRYLSEQKITEENFREIIESYEVNPNNALNDNSEEQMELYLENSPDLIKIDEDGKEYIECHIKNYQAKAKVYRDSTTVLLKGSIRNYKQNQNTASKYDEYFNNNILVENINTTPSGAYRIITKKGENGYLYLLDNNGKFLQYYRTKKTDNNIEEKIQSSEDIRDDEAELTVSTSKDQGEIMDNSIETSWDSNERKAKTIISDDLINKQANTNADAIIDKLKNIKSSKSNGLEARKLLPVNLNTGKEIKWPIDYSEDNIIKILKIKHFIMLTGVPGTGKSTASKELARKMLNADESDQVLLLSFNSATEYNDIVGGIKLMDNDDWSIKTGELTNICKLASENPDKDYIVLIDEINRGDTTGVLGEFMTALADIGSEVTTNFGISICIPNNLYIIATMNTYDSSIIELDDALKNRFAQIEMNAKEFTAEDIKPNASENLKWAIDETIAAIKDINKELSKEAFKGENNTIGFRNLYTDYEDIEGLILVVKTCIIPNIRDHYSNLDKDIKESIDKIIKKLLKDLSDIEE